MSRPRRYSTALRAEQTALTRRRILDTAGRLFIERGYRGTTLGAVAENAGVSVQTVYNVVGGKAELLKAVYTVTFTGGDEPRAPFETLPAFRAVVDAPTGRACFAAYAGLGRMLGERLLPLAKVMVASAAAGDPELGALVAAAEDERAASTRAVVAHVADRFGLRDGLDLDAAADVLWSLTMPELADRLVLRRGWGWDRFERWAGTTMADALLGPEAP